MRGGEGRERGGRWGEGIKGRELRERGEKGKGRKKGEG